MCRQFFKILSQNPDYVKTRCSDMENPPNFAIPNRMIKQDIDIDENCYGNSFSHHFRKHYH